MAFDEGGGRRCVHNDAHQGWGGDKQREAQLGQPSSKQVVKVTAAVVSQAHHNPPHAWSLSTLARPRATNNRVPVG